MERKARIVATIGPSCQDEQTLSALIANGMNVARLNFSHGTHEEHAKRITQLRALSKKFNRPITILQDLQGPKLRVGRLPSDGISLVAGQMVRLLPSEEINSSTAQKPGELTQIPLDVPDLMNSISDGKRVLLDDGNLEFEVTAVDHDSLTARVILGGVLRSNKGVNLPRTHLNIPGFTEKDEVDLQFGLSCGVDAVAISFVRIADDVRKVRERILVLDPSRKGIPIIAKIELPEALDNLHEIIHEADGVMVARGDLAVETSPANVPIVQKQIIQLANRHAKTVITATQMLDSMIHNPRPTRAEASDVANAIFDGTDAIMLSGETASGQYPVEAITMMNTIASEAELHFNEWGDQHTLPNEPSNDDAVTMTRAACQLAEDRNVAAIAVFTQTGRTALLMSKARPRVPIVALTPEFSTYHKMGLYWGVTPYQVPFASTVEGMTRIVEKALLSCTSIAKGEQVIIISGFPVGSYRPPNFSLLHTIGEKLD